MVIGVTKIAQRLGAKVKTKAELKGMSIEELESYGDYCQKRFDFWAKAGIVCPLVLLLVLVVLIIPMGG